MLQLNFIILILNSGGVLTPGVTFAKTSLIERLQKHGLTFDIIDG